MKRVELERRAIVHAIDTSPNKNITHAARRLGASRRTLQNRMRDYDIPEGEPGRPRELLPRRPSQGDAAYGALALLGVAGLAYAWWSSKETVGEDGKTECLRGLDLICAR